VGYVLIFIQGVFKAIIYYLIPPNAYILINVILSSHIIFSPVLWFYLAIVGDNSFTKEIVW